MEVRIRLQKVGKSANKHYNWRVVVIGRNKSRHGKSLDILGHYDPSKKPAVMSINREKLDQWVKRGAQMSDTVRSLVKKA